MKSDQKVGNEDEVMGKLLDKFMISLAYIQDILLPKESFEWESFLISKFLC